MGLGLGSALGPGLGLGLVLRLRKGKGRQATRAGPMPMLPLLGGASTVAVWQHAVVVVESLAPDPRPFWV